MAVDFIQKSAGNSASTTLSSAVSNTDTSFPLTSDTAFLSGGGLVIVDEGQASEELAYYTGKAGASLTVPLANRGLEGGSAQAHSSGATVKGVLSADMWNNVTEAILNVVSVTAGALDTTKVTDLTTAQTLTNKRLTSPKINEDVAVSATATELNLIDGSIAGTAVASKALVLGANKNIDTLLLSSTGGTGQGQLGWDQSNLNLNVGDGTSNQVIHVSAWTAFTPAWGGITEGNGTNTGAYCVLGKTCHFRAEFTFGNTSSATGSISLTLPVTKATGYNGTYTSQIGQAIFYDAGTGNQQGIIDSAGGIYSLAVSGANVIRATVNATAPFTWTTTDVLTVTGTYEIA